MMLLYIIFGLGAIALIVLLLTNIILRVSYIDGELSFRLTVSGIGVIYNVTRKKTVLLLGRFAKSLRRKKSPGEKTRSAKKETPKRKIRKRPKLTWALKVQITKAVILFVGRLLSRASYDVGRITVRPAIANPALAGMAYGWGQALLGAFPGGREFIDYAPVFGNERESFSGKLTISIKNRQICYLLYLLYRDLPIMGIVKQRYLTRGNNGQ